LEQVGEDGIHHPVAYAINEIEAKYVPNELEVAALVYSVIYPLYLLGNAFTVHIDHLFYLIIT